MACRPRRLTTTKMPTCWPSFGHNTASMMFWPSAICDGPPPRSALVKAQARHRSCLSQPQNRVRLASSVSGRYQRPRLNDVRLCDDCRERYRFRAQSCDLHYLLSSNSALTCWASWAMRAGLFPRRESDRICKRVENAHGFFFFRAGLFVTGPFARDDHDSRHDNHDTIAGAAGEHPIWNRSGTA